jgi:hypothetical protein
LFKQLVPGGIKRPHVVRVIRGFDQLEYLGPLYGRRFVGINHPTKKGLPIAVAGQFFRYIPVESKIELWQLVEARWKSSKKVKAGQ